MEAKKLYLVFCVLNSSPLPQLLIGLHPVRPRDHETVELRHRLPRAPCLVAILVATIASATVSTSHHNTSAQSLGYWIC